MIPGIMGSRLVDPNDGTVVWGAFGGQALDPTNPEGANVAVLPMGKGIPLAELKDDLVVDGALDRVRLSLLYVPVELRAYAEILAALGAGGYRDKDLSSAIDYGTDHFTCFQFAYDWRRSNVENAALLKEFILEQKAFTERKWAEEYGVEDADVKIDIIAHSMGGLITRYLLQYGDQPLPEDGSLPELNWEGTHYIGQVILVGTLVGVVLPMRPLNCMKD